MRAHVSAVASVSGGCSICIIIRQQGKNQMSVVMVLSSNTPRSRCGWVGGWGVGVGGGGAGGWGVCVWGGGGGVRAWVRACVFGGGGGIQRECIITCMHTIIILLDRQTTMMSPVVTEQCIGGWCKG
jgi:hypothetical protein